MSRYESQSGELPASDCLSPNEYEFRPLQVPIRVPAGRQTLGVPEHFFSKFFLSVGRKEGREGTLVDPGLVGQKERKVTNRWDGEAESQWIVAARLLYHLQYLVPYLSRLQRIHLPDRVKLQCKAPTKAIPQSRGNSRHMLLGGHRPPY